MKTTSVAAFFALLTAPAAFAGQSNPSPSANEDFVNTLSKIESLSSRSEIDDVFDKFHSFTDDEKKKIKDSVISKMKTLPKPQSSKPKRAPPAKAPSPPSGGKGGNPAGKIIAGAGAAAGTNEGLKKFLNGTHGHHHHNGTKHHGDRKHNSTRAGESEGRALLTDLFERGAPAKAPSSSSGSGVGSSIAGGVASGAASAGLTNLLNEIESHFKRRIIAIGEINGHPIDPTLNEESQTLEARKGGIGSTIAGGVASGAANAGLSNILQEIESNFKRGDLFEPVLTLPDFDEPTERSLDNHATFFHDQLAARKGGVGSSIAGGVASGAASAGLSNILQEIESNLRRRKLFEPVNTLPVFDEPIFAERSLDNHDAFFHDQLAARKGAIGSTIAGGVASGAANAGLSNILQEIESNFRRFDGSEIDALD